jgi:hypothetical protein
VIGVFHQRCNHCIEAESINVLRHFADGLVLFAAQRAHLRVTVPFTLPTYGGGLQHQRPDTLQKALDAQHAGAAPGTALIPAETKHQVAAHHIGPVLLYQIIGGDRAWLS